MECVKQRVSVAILVYCILEAHTFAKIHRGMTEMNILGVREVKYIYRGLYMNSFSIVSDNISNRKKRECQHF